MESIEVIKEKIIKTDLVLQMYADAKSKYAELFKKYKQSMDDNSILKLDNEMKSFQYSEQSKHIEKLNSDKEHMANQYNELKLSCDNQLSELVNLQVKYQTLCQDLNDCQKSEEKPHPVEREKKKRKVNKRQKYCNSSADEFPNDNVGNLNGISSEGETKSIKIEVLSSDYTEEQQPLNDIQTNLKQEESEQTKKFVADLLEELNRCKEEKSIYIKASEEREMNMLTEWRKKEESLERKIQNLQEDIQHEKEFIKNFKLKKVDETRKWEEKERILKARIADLEGKIQVENSTSLKSFEKKVQNMQTKWLEKAQMLNTEIENMKERIQEEKSVLLKNFEVELKLEWQEREEKLRMKITNLEENVDLLQKSERCKNFTHRSVQNEYINDFQSYINNPVDRNLRQYDDTKITETLNHSQKQYIEFPCLEQNEDTVDSETIMDILNEMRLTLLSPIPELKSEDELKHQIQEEPKETDWTERYQLIRRKKEMKYRMLCNMKKAKQKFKLERQLLRQKRNTQTSNGSTLAITPEISGGSNNTLVDGIDDSVSQILHRPRSPERITNGGNILGIDKILLEEAEHQIETKNLLMDFELSSCDETGSEEDEDQTKTKQSIGINTVNNGGPYETHAPGSHTPDSVDSCYESNISNPPSIQCVSKDNMVEGKNEDAELEQQSNVIQSFIDEWDSFDDETADNINIVDENVCDNIELSEIGMKLTCNENSSEVPNTLDVETNVDVRSNVPCASNETEIQSESLQNTDGNINKPRRSPRILQSNIKSVTSILKSDISPKVRKRKKPQKGSLMARTIKIYRVKNSAVNLKHNIETGSSSNCDKNNPIISNQSKVNEPCNSSCGSEQSIQKRKCSLSYLKNTKPHSDNLETSVSTFNNIDIPNYLRNNVLHKNEQSAAKEKNSNLEGEYSNYSLNSPLKKIRKLRKKSATSELTTSNVQLDKNLHSELSVCTFNNTDSPNYLQNNILHKNEQSPAKEENSDMEDEYSNSCSNSPLKKIRRVRRKSATSELTTSNVQPDKNLYSEPSLSTFNNTDIPNYLQNNILHKNEQSSVKEENPDLKGEYSNSCSNSPLKKIRKLRRKSEISELTTSNILQAKNLKSQNPTSSLTCNTNSPHERKIAPSQLDSSKINIIQDIILKSKNKALRNCEQKTEGFKRSLSTKIIPPTPQSPPPPPTREENANCLEPVVIPLDKPTKMNPDKAGSLFRRLITYSYEEKTVEEVARQFCNQEVEYISRLIAEQIIQDKEKPDAKVARAPLMTDTQRVMFGLMLKLEKMNVCNVIDTYLNTSELYLIKPDNLEQMESLTRLYVAICKSHGYIERIRRFCLDAFYFMGDFAIPFFFTVLTSWIEVLPPAKDSESFPLIKVVIQLINTKTCNTPGYNLLPLVELLHQFYEYPRQPLNPDSFFQEIFSNYLKNPVSPADFALLLYCKNSECKWVYQKIDTLMKPILQQIKNDNFKATLIILIGNIVNQFHGKWNAEYIIPIRDWLKGMTQEENIPEIVKRSLIHAIRKLPKTSGSKGVEEGTVQIVNRLNM